MIYTEKEAGHKWCPFYRVTATGWRFRLFDNRPDKINDKCIGSHCMAWNWAGEAMTHGDGEGGKIHGRRGYCGLSR